MNRRGRSGFIAVFLGLVYLASGGAVRAEDAAFSRGDTNADGTADISDAIALLTFLFADAHEPACLKSADVNDDGVLDIADVVRLLAYLFQDSLPPPPPFSFCGRDPTPDDLSCGEHPPCTVPGPAAERLSVLTHGINLTRPFWGYQWAYGSFEPWYAAEEFGADEIETILACGFRHIRLPLTDRDLFRFGRADPLDPVMLSSLRNAVSAANARELAVILDLHPGDELKEGLQGDDGAVEQTARAWGALAAAFAGTDPDRVFFEILNEPVFETTTGGFDYARWRFVLAVLHQAVREAAPAHTIIVGGVEWNSIRGLRALVPLGDRNVVYNFHFYDPFIFTHQGATWGGEPWASYHDVPYPSSPEAVRPLLDEFPLGSTAREFLEWYGLQRVGRSWIETELLRAVQWADRHRVCLTCNEFGVYAPVCGRDDLLTWHRDVCSLFAAYGIGWCKWEYNEGFSVVAYEDGDPSRPVIDRELLEAMGLPQD